MNTLLSIVIPTHNRAMYAFYAIRSILSINNSNFEIIVTDTSNTDQLHQMLNGGDRLILDSRLKYIRPSQPLDMTGNHNAAISESSGEYICLIGDDDTITIDTIEAAKWASVHNIEIIAPNVLANYAWPDFRSRHFGLKHATRLYVPKKIGRVREHLSNEAFLNALSNAGQGTDGLPKIYHGIVKRSVLQEIFERSGKYFHGSSPDVSGAVGLALCSKSFVTINYPLTIPGASGGSNTGRSALNQHKGKLSGESQTKAFENAGWSEGVPKFFSVETVWAHAALETIIKIDSEKIQYFNYARLLAICTILHPEYKAEIDRAKIQAALILNISKSELNFKIYFQIFVYGRKRISYILKRLLNPSSSGGRLFIDGLETIEEAPPALLSHMQKNGWTWREAVKGFQSQSSNH